MYVQGPVFACCTFILLFVQNQGKVIFNTPALLNNKIKDLQRGPLKFESNVKFLLNIYYITSSYDTSVKHSQTKSRQQKSLKKFGLVFYEE